MVMDDNLEKEIREFCEIKRRRGRTKSEAVVDFLEMKGTYSNELYREIMSMDLGDFSEGKDLDIAANSYEGYYDVGEEHGYLHTYRGDIAQAYKAGYEAKAVRDENKVLDRTELVVGIDEYDPDSKCAYLDWRGISGILVLNDLDLKGGERIVIKICKK
jgi:hypothetical protein